MKLDFINKRIAELCAEKHVSEREVSLAIGRSESYINYITNGKMLPFVSILILVQMNFLMKILNNHYYQKNFIMK